MANNTNTVSTRDALINTIVRQGAWAIVACAVLVYFGWQINKLIDGMGTAVAQYVSQSSENLLHLRETIDAVAKSNDQTIEMVQHNTQLINQNQEAIQQNQEAIQQNQEGIENISTLISEAAKMMEPVSAQREEQLKLLRELVEQNKSNQ